MTRDSFSFRGVDMYEAYGVRVVAQDVLLPGRRKRRVAVPGKDGTYDFGGGRYGDRVVRIACDTRRALSRDDLREMAYLLSKKGKLILWDEPDKHYIGRIYDEVELEPLGRIGHAFTLSFVCEPFAYGERRRVRFGEAALYPGTAEAPAVLTVTNKGAGLMQGIRVRTLRIE